jgi:hypothetical protein
MLAQRVMDGRLAGATANVVSTDPGVSSPWPNPISHAVDLGVNGALGALTAAIRARSAGRSVWHAVRQGAEGGALCYVGKRIIGTDVPAVGLLGREVAALGASMVRTAGDGQGLLTTAVLPVGPVRVYLGESPDEGGRPGRLHVRLDLAGSLALVYMATRPGARFDLGASVLAGAPLFDNILGWAPEHLGDEINGVIGIAGPGSRVAIAHELVHVTQYDATFIAWSEPAERALAPLVPGGGVVHRYVDVDLNVPLWALADFYVPDTEAPWEREAVLVTTRPWP